MKAFEFLAYDREGMQLAAVTDAGYCFFTGTDEQRANAEMQIMHFMEHDCFYEPMTSRDYDEAIDHWEGKGTIGNLMAKILTDTKSLKEEDGSL